ncbi:MAG: hypothetical protein LBM60_02185 [Clostridium sp.]|nr:hypothetical protein [Clostridium sp.]
MNDPMYQNNPQQNGNVQTGAQQPNTQNIYARSDMQQGYQQAHSQNLYLGQDMQQGYYFDPYAQQWYQQDIMQSAYKPPSYPLPPSQVINPAYTTDFTRGWSWGAAFLGLIYTIGMKNWYGLLSLVPILNFFWWIVMGINGKKWSWETQNFKTPEEFIAVQKTWDRAGLAYFIINAAVLLLYFSIVIFIAAIIANTSYADYRY